MSFLHRKLITVLNNFFQKNSSTVMQCSRVQQYLNYRNCGAKILLFNEKSKRNYKKSSTERIFLTFYIYIGLFVYTLRVLTLDVTDKNQCVIKYVIKCYIE